MGLVCSWCKYVVRISAGVNMIPIPPPLIVMRSETRRQIDAQIRGGKCTIEGIVETSHPAATHPVHESSGRDVIVQKEFIRVASAPVCGRSETVAREQIETVGEAHGDIASATTQGQILHVHHVVNGRSSRVFARERPIVGFAEYLQRIEVVIIFFVKGCLLYIDRLRTLVLVQHQRDAGRPCASSYPRQIIFAKEAQMSDRRVSHLLVSGRFCR